jgi:hypothetical protein
MNLSRAQKSNPLYRAGLANGKKAGFYIAFNIIQPLPINQLSKDLLRDYAGRIGGMPNRGNASLQQLRNFVSGNGQYTKIALRKNRYQPNVLEIFRT